MMYVPTPGIEPGVFALQVRRVTTAPSRHEHLAECLLWYIYQMEVCGVWLSQPNRGCGFAMSIPPKRIIFRRIFATAVNKPPFFLPIVTEEINEEINVLSSHLKLRSNI